MKKILIAVFLLLYVCPLTSAQNIQDKRRVEEEKRKALSSSEFYLPEAKKVPSPEAREEADAYFSELLSKKAARLSDAYRTIVTLMGAEERFRETQAQYDFLKEEGILPKSVLRAPGPEAPLRKGAAAYMFAKTMGIKGGVTMRLFGVSERYAFKELVYREVMFPGNVSDLMSGPELILTLTRAAEDMASGQNNKERDESQ